MRRRDFLVTAAASGLLAGCGGDEPPPPPGPTIVNVMVTGTPGMNPGPDGTDRPLTLFLLRLKETTAFEAADLYAAQADPAAAAGAGLIGMDQLVIPPGGSGAKSLTFEPEATALGLLAFPRDPAGRVWRLVAPVTPHQVTTAKVTLGPGGIVLEMS
ncbi:type VI secretion system lipoprotein TssJ [Amaricoccus solimangrovi]|nr:type VI secretion system lipoprotein TssJ [Amaricoccus solimangrovi]